MDSSKRSRTRVKLSLRKKILFSIFVTLFFFVGLECSLALFGFKVETKIEDPFVGFSVLVPLMELSTNEQGEQILSTAKNKRHWFNEQSFPRIKKPRTKRIFCMGGSTTYGHPYWDSTSFAGWLREFLPVADPSKNWEVINAGGISYASYRVAALMEELSKYEPDLFVVYSVHNEFLERRTYQKMFEKPSVLINTQAVLSRTRIWSLTSQVVHQFRSSATSAEASDNFKVNVLKGEVDEILNHTIGPVDYHRDEQWHAGVLGHYESNLRRMVNIARNAGAQIVFVTPASNEKNCSPFKSEHDSNLTLADRNRLEKLIGKFEEAITEKNSDDSLKLLEEAVRIDPHFAETHYRLGQNHFASARYTDARKEFRLALNEDICPLRAVDEITAAVACVTAELKVPVVDFETRLRALCEKEHGHTILGYEYFLDHVHPTIDVNRRLALWILEELQAKNMVGGRTLSGETMAQELDVVEEKVVGQFDDQSQAMALRNLAKVLHWAGKFEEAIPRARDVLVTIPDDLESRYILASCLNHLGQKALAMAEYEMLFAGGLDYPRAYQPYGELLGELGHLEQSKAYLLMAILHNAKNASSYFSLGVVHFQLGEFQFALEALGESNQLAADEPQTLVYLAQAKVGVGKSTEALLIYEKLIDSRILSPSIHYHYGVALMANNQRAKAILEFEKVLELVPEWEEARKQLDLARAIQD